MPRYDVFAVSKVLQLVSKLLEQGVPLPLCAIVIVIVIHEDSPWPKQPGGLQSP